jgi:rare lipoprotein A
MQIIRTLCILMALLAGIFTATEAKKTKAKKKAVKAAKKTVTYNKQTLYKGKASYYGDMFHGRRTASGEKYNCKNYTAAHRTLPFNTVVKVTNLKNNRSCLVRVNDRGPYGHRSRIIDVSKIAAVELGMFGSGTIPVRVEVLPDTVLQKFNDVVLASADNTVVHGIDTIKIWRPGRLYHINGEPVKKANGYSVQVNTFKQLQNARYECKVIEKLGYKNVYIKPEIIKGAIHYKVMAGMFIDRQIAILERKKLRKSGYDSIVARLT